MNATFVRRLVVTLAALILAGSAVSAADPVLVVETRAHPEGAYSLVLEARALCLRLALVVSDRVLEARPGIGCATCRTKDLA